VALKLSENFKKTPWFWIIAGPNGAGKSTWANSVQSKDVLGNIPILNPDNFTKPYTLEPLSLIDAGKKIFQEIGKLTSQRKDFAIETTLSGNQYFRFAEKLKRDSWSIGAVYIGVDGAEVCVTRVEERKLNGGHGVPLEDIIRRYTRSLHHIYRLLRLADYMIILDNSKNYKLILECIEGRISLEKEIPCWLKDGIED
jgi:predicted ABC-type ATPase